MKIPESPPTLQQEISKHKDNLEEFFKLISNDSIQATDHKGRYHPWEKLKHRAPPEGYTPSMYWIATSLARRKSAKKLAFVDKEGGHFTYSLPDCVVENLLWISENCAGSIRTESSLLDVRNQQTYLIQSLIEESINSSQLEGATTTRRIAKEMITSGRMPNDVSEKMIFNNHHAMNFIREIKDEKLTPSMIFELHKILTKETLDEQDKEKAGKFRTAEDDICVFSRDEQILHIPPKASELKQRLQMICDFANNTEEQSYVPPLIKAIIVHFMIGYDHPFVDGNGRTARALFYWLALKENFWLMEYISISRILKKAPVKYMYAYLHTETDNNDMTYFIIHQMDVIKEAIQDLHKYLQYKALEKQKFLQAIQNPKLSRELNQRQYSILVNALKHPGAEYTFKGHQNYHAISYQTARTDLLELSDKFNLLQKTKDGIKDVFIAPANLQERIRKI